MTSIELLLQDKGITKYRLCKETGIPWSSICSFVSGKSAIKNITLGNATKICKVLGITIDELLLFSITDVEEERQKARKDFEIYKSEICQRLKAEGDLVFIKRINSSKKIEELYKKKWYPECLYLLAMLDYICRENNIELNNKYDNIRKNKLKEPLLPKSVEVYRDVMKDDSIVEKAIKSAIPEFLKYNIVEGDIRNVY